LIHHETAAELTTDNRVTMALKKRLLPTLAKKQEGYFRKSGL